MAIALRSVFCYLRNIEYSFLSILGLKPPTDCFSLATLCDEPTLGNSIISQNPTEWLKDSILWAVPKHRRSIQKRWNRKFGIPGLHYKPFVPKSNILVCNNCGGYREAGRLCATCYNVVKTETEAMQEAIQQELKLSPVEKEVVVLYKGENVDGNQEYWKGKRIVEMPKERPPWFSKNLMQPTTQAPAVTTDVKPSDLA